MEYRYGYEEVDYVDGTQDWVWNAPQHVFFLRLRELFEVELEDLYKTLESQGAWSATSLINEFNDWQMQWPEELWRIDIERKYLRTYTGSYINGKAYPEFLTERANGRKKSQRSQFERNQEKYMSSKFGGTVASADDIILRCSVPNTDLAVTPDFDIHLTPYSHVYLSVKYNTDSRPRKIRAVPGQEYTFEYDAELADIIEIYSASCLSSVGDLSSLYLVNGTFANASKIRELTLGSNIDGYENTNVMTLGLGSNELLNKLDIQNMSGLTHSLDLSGLKNLEELYAFGSGASGVIFADGGNIKVVQIPDVGTLQMKNLAYLDDDGFESSATANLSRLVAENSKLDLISIINDSANLRQIRLIGIDWTLENGLAENDEDREIPFLNRLYKLAGVTNTGGNLERSVLSGKVTVPVIRQQKLKEYQDAWPDLDIRYNTIVYQHPITFVNHDGSVLDIQYIDEGKFAVDPTKRAVDPIEVPTKESTISTNYTFSGWDTEVETLQVFEAKTVTALYAEETREYTARYVSKGIVVQETSGLYGKNITYTGNIPTYTSEEGAYNYCLFKGWDKSGFLDGDFNEEGVKTITAIFDEFKYTSGAFADKKLSDLSPVQIYALTKLTEPIDKDLSDFGMSIETSDEFSFTMGYDVDYGDVESVEVISEKKTFDGSNYYDSGIALFDVDRDFVLAVDYKMSSGNSSGATLMQCFQTSGNNGFKLSYSSSPQFAWGSSVISDAKGNAISPSTVDAREMLVIRHKKGDNNLYVYVSNIATGNRAAHVITKTGTTQSDTATLVFGAMKQDSGRFVNNAIGEVNWCKIWYKDLGESDCMELVGWPHEKVNLEVSGFYRYQLFDDYSKDSMMSLLAKNLLSIKKPYNVGGGNSGGWAESDANEFLNTRFYGAIPYQIRSLMKKVSVTSTVGDNNSTDTSSSGCYVTLPALYDVNNDPGNNIYISEVYDPNGTIAFMTGETLKDTEPEKTNRRRAYEDGTYGRYLLRSPSFNTGWTTTYCWTVDENGVCQQVSSTNTAYGLLIEISF